MFFLAVTAVSTTKRAARACCGIYARLALPEFACVRTVPIWVSLEHGCCCLFLKACRVRFCALGLPSAQPCCPARTSVRCLTLLLHCWLLVLLRPSPRTIASCSRVFSCVKMVHRAVCAPVHSQYYAFCACDSFDDLAFTGSILGLMQTWCGVGTHMLVVLIHLVYVHISRYNVDEGSRVTIGEHAQFRLKNWLIPNWVAMLILLLVACRHPKNILGAGFSTHSL